MASSSLRDQKQVQDARFDNHAFDRRQERKFLLPHENNITQQRVLRESENKFAMLKKFILSKQRAL